MQVVRSDGSASSADVGELVLLSQKAVACAMEARDVAGGCGRAHSTAELQHLSQLWIGVGKRQESPVSPGVLHRREILLVVTISLLTDWSSYGIVL